MKFMFADGSYREAMPRPSRKGKTRKDHANNAHARARDNRANRLGNFAYKAHGKGNSSKAFKIKPDRKSAA